MNAPLHKNAVASDTLQRIRALWEDNKRTCGWFLRADFVPQTQAELVSCLGWLKKNGNRETYVLARKLEKCL